MTNFIEEIETRELIQKLIDNGFGRVVDAFTSQEQRCLTKKSRLNKSGTCRVLEIKPKDLENTFKSMRELLSKDLGILEDDQKE